MKNHAQVLFHEFQFEKHQIINYGLCYDDSAELLENLNAVLMAAALPSCFVFIVFFRKLVLFW